MGLLEIIRVYACDVPLIGWGVGECGGEQGVTDMA